MKKTNSSNGNGHANGNGHHGRKFAAPSYKSFKVSDLKIDPSYQRDLDEKRVAAMAAAFDPTLLGVPVVTIRTSGDVYVLDGQHRRALAERVGKKDLFCEVRPCRNLEEEARVFLDLNGLRTAVREFDKFEARLIAKEPVATTINTIIEGEGLRLCKHRVDRGVSAISSIEYAHRQHGNLGRVLRTLAMWQDGNPVAFGAVFIRDLSAFFAAYPKAEDTRVVAALQSVAPDELKRKVKASQTDLLGTRQEAALRTLRTLYNVRCRGRQKLERRTDSDQLAIV